MDRTKYQAALNYIKVSRNLAEHDNRLFPLVLSRIIASRIFYGMGPDAYDRRRFSNKKLRQIREYLSLREREDLQKSLCPKDARISVENKLRFHELCMSHGLPTPPIHGVFMIRDGYVPQDIPIVRSTRDLQDFINRLPAGKYIIKPVNAAHGWAVSAIHIENGRAADFSGRDVDLDRFFSQAAKNRYNAVGFMFQEYIRPHPELKPIMPGPGLGTFRIVTFLVGEATVDIPFAVVKIPVGGNVTDNFAGGYSGNWVCPVDVTTGILGNAVGKTDSVPVFSEIETHADTGATFRGTSVPLWEEVKSTIVESALAFSDLRAIGWDVAVTDGGVCILEANWDWGENLIEVAHNRGLRRELTELTNKSLASRRV